MTLLRCNMDVSRPAPVSLSGLSQRLFPTYMSPATAGQTTVPGLPWPHWRPNRERCPRLACIQV